MRKLLQEKPWTIALLYFILTTLCITYPLIFHLSDYITGKGDELLIVWIMHWNIYALFHQPLHLFDANIFYPYHTTLAYSETFFTSTLIAAIPLLLCREPAMAFNSNLLFTLITVGFFTYLLVYSLTKNFFAGIISGTLLAFSTFTLTRIAIIHVIGIEWIPLALLFFIKFCKTYQAKYWVFFCVFFVLQLYNSFLPGYLIVFSVVCLILFTPQKKKLFQALLTKQCMIASLCTLIAILAVGLPFYAVSQEFHYTRDIRDAIQFANRPEYTFYPSSKTRLEGIIHNLLFQHDTGPYKYDGYLGFVLIVLTISLLFYSFVYPRKKIHKLFLPFLLIGAGSFLLSLGPAFQWGGHVIKKPFIIPLPYAIAYYVVPGFKGLRNSGRWEMLTVFALCVAAGLFLAKVYKGRPLWLVKTITVILCVLVLAEISFPLPYESIPTKEQFPQVYPYLASLPQKSSLIELPLYSWYMAPYSMNEFMREYYSTADFQPMVNGYSGFSPHEWERRSDEYMTEFPDDKTIGYLRSIHLDYIILHKKEYDTLEKNGYTILKKPAVTFTQVQQGLKKYRNIVFLKQFGDDYVYKITY